MLQSSTVSYLSSSHYRAKLSGITDKNLTGLTVENSIPRIKQCFRCRRSAQKVRLPRHPKAIRDVSSPSINRLSAFPKKLLSGKHRDKATVKVKRKRLTSFIRGVRYLFGL